MFNVRISRKKHRDIGKVAAKLKGPKKVKVGFPAGKVGGDIVQRAVWNEFGTKGGASGGGWGGPVPERPFMRNAMRGNRGKYQKAMRAAAHEILTGAALLRPVLGKLGALAQGDIQEEITSMSSPPNSPVTIARKGSSNPLIDTGEMRSRVSWKVEE